MKTVHTPAATHVYMDRTLANGAQDCVSVAFDEHGAVRWVRSNGRAINPDGPKARKAIEAARKHHSAA